MSLLAYKASGELYNFRDRAALSTLIKAVQEIETQIQSFYPIMQPF